MGNKRILAPLSVLTAVTLCLLLGTAPSAVTVTSWPNTRQTTFTIDDPARLAQLWALIEDVPLPLLDVAMP